MTLQDSLDMVVIYFQMIQITFQKIRLEAFMSNLFQRISSSWVRYDKYEWKEDKEGTLYITPSPDAKVSLYNPLKDSEQMVLKAVNLGLICMDKNNTQEQLQNAIMDFITYHAVYLPKNHFIKEESMTTEKYFSYFFPFDKIDFVKKEMESSWNTDDVQMMALIMTMKSKPQAVIMSFQKEYAERYKLACYAFQGLGIYLYDKLSILSGL